MTSARRDALSQFVEELKRLRLRCGSPSLSRLADLTVDDERPLRRSTISDKLNGKSLPDWDFVVSFVAACRAYAYNGGQVPADKVFDLAGWDVAHWRLLHRIDEGGNDDRLVAAARAEIHRRGEPGASSDQDTVSPGLPPAANPVVPRQLPASVRHFTGREAELRTLDDLVDQAGHPGGEAHSVMIAVVTGTAGVGKTALAVHWAHRVVDRFPDGQLYVNLRGFDPSGSPMTAAEAIRGFLDAFSIAPQQIPASLDAQAALYRSIVAGKRILIVLDNACDAEHVRPLLPGSPPALALVTSRDRLTGLIAGHSAPAVALGLFTTDDARAFITCRLAPERVTAEPEAVDEIIARCARLPLALAIVSARAAGQPTFPLSTLASELRDGAEGLDALTDSGPVTDVRHVFSWSCRTLSPGAARLFRLLGLHPGPDITAPAAASLADLPVRQVRSLLGELTRANLVAEHAPARYTFHDLLRAYAAELAHATEPEAQCRAATHRMLDHYLRTACGADRLLDSHRDPISLATPKPGAVPERLADRTQALAWFAAELAVLVSLIDRARASGWPEHTWQLAWTLVQYLNWRGMWHTLIDLQRTALAAARDLSDHAFEAGTHRYLSLAYAQLDRLDEAGARLNRALDLYRECGDIRGEAGALVNLSWLCERQSRFAHALDHAREALDRYHVLGDRPAQASAANTVGWYLALLGNYREALPYSQEALATLQECGDSRGEADTWDSLGYIHHHLGEDTRATDCYQRALAIARQHGDRYLEATILTHLGDVWQTMAEHSEARDAYHRALTILSDLGHPDEDGVRARLRGVEEGAD